MGLLCPQLQPPLRRKQLDVKKVHMSIMSMSNNKKFLKGNSDKPTASVKRAVQNLKMVPRLSEATRNDRLFRKEAPSALQNTQHASQHSQDYSIDFCMFSTLGPERQGKPVSNSIDGLDLSGLY